MAYVRSNKPALVLLENVESLVKKAKFAKDKAAMLALFATDRGP